MTKGYAEAVRDILNQELDEDDRIAELAELCETLVNQAHQDGQDDADNKLQDDLLAAEDHWREIVASFKRNDFGDVRSRLMDLGTRIFNVDVWIPS